MSGNEGPWYIVVWTTRTTLPRIQPFAQHLPAVAPTTYNDRWEAFTDEHEARERLQAVVDRDETWTASICAVIDSTDYEPHPQFDRPEFEVLK